MHVAPLHRWWENSCCARINTEEVLLITAGLRGRRCSLFSCSATANQLYKWIKVCVFECVHVCGRGVMNEDDPAGSPIDQWGGGSSQKAFSLLSFTSQADQHDRRGRWQLQVFTLKLSPSFHWLLRRWILFTLWCCWCVLEQWLHA